LDFVHVATHVQRRVGVLGDHQADLGQVDVALFAPHRQREALKAHAAARREKSRGRKPRASRHPAYTAPPRTTNPITAGIFFSQPAASHHAEGPIAKNKVSAMSPTAPPTFSRKTGQPATGL